MITSGCICSDNEKKVFVLPIKFNGLDLLDYCETQNIEYRNSREVTKYLTENIILQNKIFEINAEEIKKSKNKLKPTRKLNEVTANIYEQSKRCIDVIHEVDS